MLMHYLCLLELMVLKMSKNIKNIEIVIKSFSNFTIKQDKDIKIAVNDIIEDNDFHVLDIDEKEYSIKLEIIENMLVLDLQSTKTNKIYKSISINLNSINKILKEYILLCNSYYDAIKSAPIQKVEALDMGRRSLHDDASHELLAKLKQYAYMDFSTARRFTTLLSIIYRKSLVGENIFN